MRNIPLILTADFGCKVIIDRHPFTEYDFNIMYHKNLKGNQKEFHIFRKFWTIFRISFLPPGGCVFIDVL